MRARAEKFPVTINRSGHVVKIYRITNRGRTMFQTCHRIGKSRILKNFADESKARAHANLQADLLSAGNLTIAAMNPEDRQTLTAAMKILKPLGIPLLPAVTEYAAAMAKLQGRGSLVAAATEYAQRHIATGEQKTCAQVVELFLKSRETAGLSKVYVHGCKMRLEPFAERFATNIGAVKTADIEAWLDSLKMAPRTRKNAVSSIKTLFKFAQRRGYLPKNQRTEADDLELPDDKGGKIEILAPDELSKILKACDTEERALFFSLGAFTGIRTAELMRLRWEDINLAGGHVTVTADNAKTAARRLVPICPALSAWLAKYEKPKGKLFQADRASDRLTLWARGIIGRWPQNACRHSFASYRLAKLKNAGEVALEMGNSPTMIFRHYRELVTATDADAWFSVMPDKPANVVPMGKKKEAA